MSQCRSCSASVPPDARFCSSCGGALEHSSTDPSPGEPPDATLRHSTPSSHPSRRPSSDSFDLGRFLPGAVLADRYRIVGLLGRGGMGEVYRADDLKLGQPVALKFLPEELQDDETRLDRLLAEVRMARQVSHARVCRVYDVGEVDGQHYLSMEYVDGEDLASLLRRIGRLPQGKSGDIARQICAGLAAAHEQGILHRDLKPANVMIDGRGQVRLTDFGLAALADTVDRAEARAGTPAYMAPEQLAGREVTVQSDLYSLGLVLYEIFTGQRAFSGDTYAEMLRVREESTPTSPTEIVEGLEPSVERVILRCLEADPGRRPASALAVAAALPGGDPIAEALAAGELPSPEMVAEAGSEGGLRPAVAWSLLAAVLLGIVLVISQAGRSQLVRMVPLDKSPDVLVERAREVLARVGYTDPPRDQAFGFYYSGGYLSHIARHDSSSTRWERLARGEPSVLRFGYRQSPRIMLPYNRPALRPSSGDPPLLVPGMTRLALDSQGRLLAFEAVPPRFDDSEEAPPEPDWSSLFQEAGLDVERFTAVEPQWAWPIHSDRRFAWEGVYPESEDLEIRVEAASARGRPVRFHIVAPWDQASAPGRGSRSWLARAAGVVYLVGSLSTLAAALLIARANLRRGRGDRKGALRLALYLLGAEMTVWLFKAHHVADAKEIPLFFGPLASALLWTIGAWVLYIALEPLARRHWPQALVSWVRLLNGQFRDPLVGRDCLLGCVIGVAIAGNDLFFQIAPPLWGDAAPRPDSFFFLPATLEVLRGLRQAVAVALRTPIDAVQTMMLYVVFLVLLRVLLRKTWLAVTLFGAVGAVAISGRTGDLALDLLYPLVPIVVLLVVFFRFGLLPMIFGMWFTNTLVSFPLTFDFSVWYGGRTLIGLVVLVGLAVYGFRVSLAGRPAVRASFLE